MGEGASQPISWGCDKPHHEAPDEKGCSLRRLMQHLFDNPCMEKMVALLLLGYAVVFTVLVQPCVPAHI
jgi:hypothetical protein